MLKAVCSLCCAIGGRNAVYGPRERELGPSVPAWLQVPGHMRWQLHTDSRLVLCRLGVIIPVSFLSSPLLSFLDSFVSFHSSCSFSFPPPSSPLPPISHLPTLHSLPRSSQYTFTHSQQHHITAKERTTIAYQLFFANFLSSRNCLTDYSQLSPVSGEFPQQNIRPKPQTQKTRILPPNPTRKETEETTNKQTPSTHHRPQRINSLMPLPPSSPNPKINILAVALLAQPWAPNPPAHS